MTVNLYFYDNNLNLINKGEFNIVYFDELLAHFLVKSKDSVDYDDYNGYVYNTTFMLSRSKQDSLAITMVDANKVTIFSKKLYCSDTFFYKMRKLLFNYQASFINHLDFDWATAKMICQDYITLDRQTFEHKYQKFCLLKPSSDGD